MDIFIQEQPFINQRDISTLSYSYTSHSKFIYDELIHCFVFRSYFFYVKKKRH